MPARKVIGVLAAAVSAAGFSAYRKYRWDLREISKLTDSGGTIVDTSAGPIEYAEEGSGEPMLVIHGAGGGYDQGLMIGRGLGQGFRLIAPSRFGYLNTPVPADNSPLAQAIAHAALLDSLGIDRCVVVGASAGAPSAIEFALRFPKRASALILLVPRTYDPTMSIGPDEGMASQTILQIIEKSADFLFWAAMRAAPRSVMKFLGVRPEVYDEASQEDRAYADAIMRSLLPLSRRAPGLAVDGAADIKPWPLERLSVPTLIISAEDDLFGTLPGARFTAEQIPGAELRVLNSGGHLMLGHGERVRRWIHAFLEKPRAEKERVPRKHDRHVAKALEPIR